MFEVGDKVIAVETGCPGVIVKIKGNANKRYDVLFNAMAMDDCVLPAATIEVNIGRIRRPILGEWHDGVHRA